MRHTPPPQLLALLAACMATASLVLTPAGALADGSLTGQAPRQDETPEPDPYERYIDAEDLGSGWFSERLLPRPMPEDPAQADYGAQDYYQICMACHGDIGQGLTDEWREAWGDDSNCWESKCHAANHPPQGFDLPRTVVPVMGAGTLLSYASAWDLYRKIAETMPWWNPGSLSDTQAQNLTAYLLRERGELPAGLPLDAGNTQVIRLHVVPEPRGNERIAALGLLGLLGVGALAMALRTRS